MDNWVIHNEDARFWQETAPFKVPLNFAAQGGCNSAVHEAATQRKLKSGT
ncbi:hypothetical protein A11S_729 [Micavibrio aeruginosavorus EPB]|uniref:Uncharacterized protein n=1 Tax=Micavibrio aeruginosavorus EPB TaxID=349215 RepID=M4VEB9_9BACT|nr:hypothetical protein A11S_729 [Micavibrio aeruginosavorus EPB]